MFYLSSSLFLGRVYSKYFRKDQSQIMGTQEILHFQGPILNVFSTFYLMIISPKTVYIHEFFLCQLSPRKKDDFILGTIFLVSL